MLPLLPQDLIIETFEGIVLKLNAYYLKLFDKLIAYIRSYWFLERGIREFCVYRQVRRTSNHIESYHSRLKRLLSKRPSMWNLLLELVDISTKTVRNIRISKNGGIISGKNGTQTVAKEMQLARLWGELDTGLILPETFLIRASRVLQKRKRAFKVIDIPADSEDSTVDEVDDLREISKTTTIMSIGSHSPTFTTGSFSQNADPQLHHTNVNNEINEKLTFSESDFVDRQIVEDMSTTWVSSMLTHQLSHTITDSGTSSAPAYGTNISNKRIISQKVQFNREPAHFKSTPPKMPSLPRKLPPTSTVMAPTRPRSPCQLKYMASTNTSTAEIPQTLATPLSTTQFAPTRPSGTQLPCITARPHSVISPYFPPPLSPVTASITNGIPTSPAVSRLASLPCERQSTATGNVQMQRYVVPLSPAASAVAPAVPRRSPVANRQLRVLPTVAERLRTRELPVLSHPLPSRQKKNSRRVSFSPLQQEIMRQYMQQQRNTTSKSPPKKKSKTCDSTN